MKNQKNEIKLQYAKKLVRKNVAEVVGVFIERQKTYAVIRRYDRAIPYTNYAELPAYKKEKLL